MQDNRLDKYLDEIGGEQKLTADEERILSERVRSGDDEAQQQLVVANLKLVVAVASRYQGKGLSMDDLVSEGNIGLMKAAAKYDGRRGSRFASYATMLIRQHIERALALEQGATGDNAPTRRAEEPVKKRTADAVKMRSVDAPLGIKPNMSLLSVLVDGNAPLADEGVEQSDSVEVLGRALAVLNDREQHVVKAFFGIGQETQTMAEIAIDMGLKRERVRQIRDRAVRRLRKIGKSA